MMADSDSLNSEEIEREMREQLAQMKYDTSEDSAESISANSETSLKTTNSN
jgi:hypothetical protein